MNINRRAFLHGVAATAGVAGVSSCIAAKLGEPNLRLGILSDVHITKPGSEVYFIKALEWFRERDVDGVIIAGDITDHGFHSQFQIVSDSWYKVFPGDKGKNNRHVEKVFVNGNHDVIGHTYGWTKKTKEEKDAIVKQTVFQDLQSAWKKYFHEDYKDIYVKDIKGYKFIGAHWDRGKGFDVAEKFIMDVAKNFDPKRPFFYVQHPPLKDTIFGDYVWGCDSGSATKALKNFPNAIAFAGHTHFSLTDERDIWQDSFTAIGTCSLHYTGMMGGRENSYNTFNANKNIDWQMPALNTYDCKQGMLMSVYDNEICLERREFKFNQSLGADWVMPIPTADKSSKVYMFEPRSSKSTAPEFTADAAIKIMELKDGKNRRKKPVEQIQIEFPAAVSKGSRVWEYEVEVYNEECGFKKTYSIKRIFPYGYNHPEARIEKTTKCLFAKSELPRQVALTFSVKPLNCWGKAGSAMVMKKYVVN